MKDNLLWPGFILLAVAFSGMISTAAVAAYGHYEWLATTVVVAVVGTVAGGLWFVWSFAVSTASKSTGYCEGADTFAVSALPAAS